MEKSYNQRYKESGTTLTYKEWRRREDEKMSSFNGIESPYKSLKDSIGFQQTKQQMLEQGGYKSKESGKTVLGIRNSVFIVAGLIVAASIGYVIYKKVKK